MTAVAVDDAATMTSISKMLREPIFRCLLQSVRGCRQTAEDLVQETMLRAWRSFASMPEEDEQRRRWVFAIARNVAIDAARARRVRPEAYDGMDLNLLPAGASEADRVAAVHSVRQVVAELPAIHRDVIVDLYFDERTMAETADHLRIPIGTVKSRAHNALRTMRLSLAA